MAYRTYYRLDGQELPRTPGVADSCALCGAQDGQNGSWLVWQTTTGDFLCEDCQ